MRKALVVGIDHYADIPLLSGCVSDAVAVDSVLRRHDDGKVNFAVRLRTASDGSTALARDELRALTEELFKGEAEIALFYYAGHGYVESTGGYLCPSDCRNGHDGLSLGDVMTFAMGSDAQNKVIVLDSCHSGIAGASMFSPHVSELKEGTTILTASTAEQVASEDGNGGLFTALLLDALRGAAANLVGDVTPGSVYAHIDQSLGPWEQRPVFKSNVKRFVSARRGRSQ